MQTEHTATDTRPKWRGSLDSRTEGTRESFGTNRTTAPGRIIIVKEPNVDFVATVTYNRVGETKSCAKQQPNHDDVTNPRGDNALRF